MGMDILDRRGGSNDVEVEAAGAVDALDRTSPVPLFHQLKQLLRSRVENGEWKPGAQIPTEAELCERYMVSKITANQAIKGLVAEGMLYRLQGKGTFVRAPKIEQGPLRLTSFSEQMKQMGLRPGGILRERTVVSATKKLAKQLGVQVGTPVIRMERLRLANDEPMGIQTSHIPLSMCPQLMQEDVGPQSLYRILEKYGIRLLSAVERYEAVLVEEYESSLLQVPIGSPAFLVERLAYDMSGHAVELARSVMRGDRYAVTVALRAETT